MAELGSVVDSYDSKLAEFQQSFGDLQAWDSVVKERVNGLEQSLNNLKVNLAASMRLLELATHDMPYIRTY